MNELDPVLRSAFYCAGVRAEDAERPQPICNDVYAARLLGEDGRATFERFRRFSRPNASNIARHRLVDDLLRARLRVDLQHRIVLLGAGLDSRPFRLKGGRWLELDAAPIISRKNAALPVSECPNHLGRVVVDFSVESLGRALAPLGAGEPVTVVMEGVLFYIALQKIDELLAALGEALPRHELICDLMNQRFLSRQSAELQVAIGATFDGVEPNPAERIFRAGYTLRSRTSIVHRAAQLKAIDVPPLVVRWLLPSVRDGFGLYVFQHGGPPGAY